MPKVFTSKNQKTGEIAEHIVARHLENKGFKVIERNYTKKWGEIDIIAKKGKKLYFIEVKSGSKDSDFRPEENMHGQKLRRLSRTVQTYLLEQRHKGPWQVDLAIVRVDTEKGEARVKMLENIII